MNFPFGTLCFFIMIMFFLNPSDVEARYHFHKKQKIKDSNKSPVSAPKPESPVFAPNPKSPVSESPSYFPPIPSDPNDDPIAEDPNDPGNSTLDCIFDVTSFGASGDGSSDDAVAFMAAWNLEGSLCSRISCSFSSSRLHIHDHFNSFYGPCTIEGNGYQWWELPCKPHKLIRFFMISNLVVSALRIQNTTQFHTKFDGCEGVLIEKQSISSPKLSPNTDGIHIENTKSVGIYDSVIAYGKKKLTPAPFGVFGLLSN